MFDNGSDTRWRIAENRLGNILRAHIVAQSRTLEQKISDSGPINQRIDPHVLTEVRNILVDREEIICQPRNTGNWFFLKSVPVHLVQQRLKEQEQILKSMKRSKNFGKRVGQCLEIAIFRSLPLQSEFEFFGRFKNLEEHDDSVLYEKEEPPQSISERSLPGDERLDFLVNSREGGWGGIEAKNVREWIYPDRDEIRKLLRNCIDLDCVPILIARRIPFVTFFVLSKCGVIFHQTYNQLLPSSEKELAEKIKDKHLLGYHYIRLGNTPDARLQKFFSENLPKIFSDARYRFEKYKDLLNDFAYENVPYKEFSARVRRRYHGTNEDHDWDDNPVY
ncbi:MAG: hypothetical protein F4W92_08985 [Gammaproteobacteria bacterium]|nr:hypothetical protein [Gammaproteobacteria bacterium]